MIVARDAEAPGTADEAGAAEADIEVDAVPVAEPPLAAKAPAAWADSGSMINEQAVINRKRKCMTMFVYAIRKFLSAPEMAIDTLDRK